MDKFKDENLRAIKARVSQETGVSFERKRKLTFRPLIVAALIVCLFTAGAFAAYRISLGREILDGNDRLSEDGSFFISMPFGMVTDPSGYTKEHEGIDYPAKPGTPVLAAADGTVSETGYTPGYGNYVMIDHGDGYVTMYAHMEDILTEEGREVSEGDQIGTVGSTGRSTVPHLHFGLYVNGEAVNPADYFGE